MSLIDPRNNVAVAEFISIHQESNYKKYLQNYDKQFAAYSVDSICASSRGITFVLAHDSAISALVQLKDLDWDTECLGFKVCQVSAIVGNDTRFQTSLLEEAIDYCRVNGTRLLTVRMAADDFSSLHALETVGFRLVDSMNVFLWDGQSDIINSHSRDTGGRITLGPLERDDQEIHRELREIAISAFQYGRLNNDPNFSTEQIRHFYGSLFDSIAGKEKSLTLVARVEGRLAGFVTGERDSEISRYLSHSLGYLWLIAVAGSAAGQGVGQALLEEFLRSFSAQVRFIEVATQVNNYSALSLYARSGLKPVSSLVTMHLWL